MEEEILDPLSFLGFLYFLVLAIIYFLCLELFLFFFLICN